MHLGGVMRTHATIIADAGGYRGLAAKLGIPEGRVRFWWMRKSIPTEVWRAVAHAQLATLEELAEASEVRAAIKAHPPSKDGRAKKPATVKVDSRTRAARPKRVARRGARKGEAAA